MTAQPINEFALRLVGEPTALTVHITGEVGYDTGDDLVHAVVDHLGGHPGLHEVRLDFRDLTWIDSSGLSALLLVHRRTSAAGAALRLDHLPGFLQHRLRLTGVLDHLTAPVAPARGEDEDARRAGAT
ncbi:STAS domain-containing protein [Streptomyces sp. TG1A-8]|uniref:STAS domain-containing protein n=1 Tax=Streptomyces sp. TG1A-8 TaxID=3051385 RepID=UPI00265BDBB1|nr:STAS domain-containing protein [Streptomyces sp. TG1A-8]MDO0929289.1 STAS domain-containing protein [Streptomyces sp. TG1A-8]